LWPPLGPRNEIIIMMVCAQVSRFTAHRSLLTEKIAPMLAYSSPPFDSPQHLLEIKWDGTRCLLFFQDQSIRLQNRRLQDITPRYPDLAGLHRQINGRNAVLDGELVVLSEGRADFRKLQQREQVADPMKISLVAKQIAATYIVFDVLYRDDEPCLHLPLSRRKEILAGFLKESGQMVESGYVEARGLGSGGSGPGMRYGQGLDSPYLIGKRSQHWLKIKPRGKAICFIVGYSKGQGTRADFFGSLALATREGQGWRFRGMVGSGFNAAELQEIKTRLTALEQPSPAVPLDETPRGITWVRPELRCEVTFQAETPRGHFRAPAFIRLIE
jgi:bifunctional non-homologous end joining protein LigD